MSPLNLYSGLASPLMTEPCKVRKAPLLYRYLVRSMLKIVCLSRAIEPICKMHPFSSANLNPISRVQEISKQAEGLTERSINETCVPSVSFFFEIQYERTF